MTTNNTGMQNSPGPTCPHCGDPPSEWNDNNWLPQHMKQHCPKRPDRARQQAGESRSGP